MKIKINQFSTKFIDVRQQLAEGYFFVAVTDLGNIFYFLFFIL